MKKLLLLTAAMVAALWMPAWGQVAETPLQSAALAWDRGDYTSALVAYLQILESPDAGAALETIALQTGELYHTTELTADGQAPLFSPDGRHIAYETGAGITRRTRVVPANGTTTPVVELPGSGAAFSVDGLKIAYLRLAPVGELIAAQASVDASTPAKRPQRQNALNQLIAALTRLVVRDIASGPETTIDTGFMRKTSLAGSRARDDAHPPLPQQHRAYDCARIFLDDRPERNGRAHENPDRDARMPSQPQADRGQTSPKRRCSGKRLRTCCVSVSRCQGAGLRRHLMLTRDPANASLYLDSGRSIQ